MALASPVYRFPREVNTDFRVRKFALEKWSQNQTRADPALVADARRGVNFAAIGNRLCVIRGYIT